jgi:hypothetical protein
MVAIRMKAIRMRSICRIIISLAVLIAFSQSVLSKDEEKDKDKGLTPTTTLYNDHTDLRNHITTTEKQQLTQKSKHTVTTADNEAGNTKQVVPLAALQAVILAKQSHKEDKKPTKQSEKPDQQQSSNLNLLQYESHNSDTVSRRVNLKLPNDYHTISTKIVKVTEGGSAIDKMATTDGETVTDKNFEMEKSQNEPNEEPEGNLDLI